MLRPSLKRISRADADDIAIDAINSMIRKYLANAQDVDWLTMNLPEIARNKCADLLRKRNALKRGGGKVDSIEDQPPGTEFRSENPDPSEELQRLDEVRLMDKALSQLPEIQCNVIKDHSWNGLSYTELAKKYGKTEGHIGKIIHDGRKALKQNLLRLGFPRANVKLACLT